MGKRLLYSAVEDSGSPYGELLTDE